MAFACEVKQIQKITLKADGDVGVIFGAVADNVKTLGEEADFQAQTFSLAQTPIESTNVEFSTKTAFLPSVCYAFGLFIN